MKLSSKINNQVLAVVVATSVVVVGASVVVVGASVVVVVSFGERSRKIMSQKNFQRTLFFLQNSKRTFDFLNQKDF